MKPIALVLAAASLLATPVVAAPTCPGFNADLHKALNFTPDTASPEARADLDKLAAMFGAAAAVVTDQPKTVDDWDRKRNQMAGFVMQIDGPRLSALPEKITDDTIAGVPVVRITPPSSATDGRVLIYIHGGGYTMGTAHSSLIDAAHVADVSHLTVISIDYQTAPRGNWKTATDQVLAVYKALLKDGHTADQIGMFGGSAGGGLVGGSVFKMRDQGLPLPGALVLLSPWSDITETGDTYCTLENAEPLLNYETGLKASADLYAAPEDQKNPYVSPVYGDYSKGYPPMLIQGGTREIFLSNFIRQYQAATSAGQVAVLDLYEGMPHTFQALIPDSPEAKTAFARAAAFFATHLRSPKS